MDYMDPHKGVASAIPACLQFLQTKSSVDHLQKINQESACTLLTFNFFGCRKWASRRNLGLIAKHIMNFLKTYGPAEKLVVGRTTSEYDIIQIQFGTTENIPDDDNWEMPSLTLTFGDEEAYETDDSETDYRD